MDPESGVLAVKEMWAISFGGLNLLVALLTPSGLEAQSPDRIWGRVHTVSGQVHEGFIRWDRNEGSWADVLDGYKETEPFEFQDWWRLAHPDDSSRDRVVELMGYRITWDDETPRFPSSVESGIRFGHVLNLVPDPADPEQARLGLRSEGEVVLRGGATDLGPDLREIRISMPGRDPTVLEWEDLASVEFFRAPDDVAPQNIRLFGTLYLRNGSAFTGFITWDLEKIVSSDRLEGRERGGRERQIPFHGIREIRPLGEEGGEGAEILLADGSQIVLSGSDDVDDGNDGTLVSDPALGQIEVAWEELDHIRFHQPPEPALLDRGFDRGGRLFGTVLTSDSTQLTGWIRWDGDEEYGWELLNGRDETAEFQVELGLVTSIHKNLVEATAVNLGPEGMTMTRPLREEGSRVVLVDGRELVLEGSNDVDESNHGVFILPRTNDAQANDRSPSDPAAEWIWVRWDDFLEVRFHDPTGQGEGGTP